MRFKYLHLKSQTAPGQTEPFITVCYESSENDSEISMGVCYGMSICLDQFNYDRGRGYAVGRFQKAKKQPPITETFLQYGGKYTPRLDQRLLSILAALGLGRSGWMASKDLLFKMLDELQVQLDRFERIPRAVK